MRVKELVAFIKEREAIRLAKEAGQPRGLWTKDPILATYRFCNVRREDDRMTRQLRGYADVCEATGHEDEWFWWVVARLFNKDQTMAAIDGTVLPFSLPQMARKLEKQRQRYTIFNGAYIVSTNGKSMDKVEYILRYILAPLWKDRKRLRPTINDTLDSWHQLLMTYDGLGSFMAAQVVADMKYVAPLDKASDWWTFAASGPGSRRGLNRVMGCLPGEPWSEANWREQLRMLEVQVNRMIPKGWEPLHCQDLQNCLCEFDKYERARLGEGKPKQLYKEK